MPTYPVQTEGKYIHDVLLMEGENYYSREVVTLTANNTFEVGSVMEDSGGKKVPLAVDANADSILLLIDKAPDASNDGIGIAIVRFGIVNRANLNYHGGTSGATDPVLIALGILPRDESPQIGIGTVDGS